MSNTLREVLARRGKRWLSDGQGHLCYLEFPHELTQNGELVWEEIMSLPMTYDYVANVYKGKNKYLSFFIDTISESGEKRNTYLRRII